MNKISKYFFKIFTGKITEAERKELENWQAEDKRRANLYSRLSNPEYLREEYLIRSLIDTERAENEMKRRITMTRTPIYKKYAAAAAVVAVIAITAVIALYTSDNNIFDGYQQQPDLISDSESQQSITIDDIKPGESKAIITDLEGKSLALNELDTMKAVSELYVNRGLSPQPKELCLEVPRGGEFKILLEDSTEVWLNAESKLFYPQRFSSKERRVRISGEAYFSVKKDSKRPFYVESGNQLVRVYGTEFNIRDYAEDKAVVTTLESGKIALSKLDEPSTGEIILSPGNQAVFGKEDSRVSMKTVDPTVITGWRHGRFVFEEQPLEVIMRDLSRWYNFAYEFTDPSVGKLIFMGSIPRYSDFKTAIQILENCGDITFTPEADKIIISRKS